MEQCLKLERDGIQRRALTIVIVILLSVFMIIRDNETDYRKMNVDGMEESSAFPEVKVEAGSIILPETKTEAESIALQETKAETGSITLPKAEVESITFMEMKAVEEIITLPKTKPEVGSIIFMEMESDRENYTYPEMESDRESYTYPEIESDREIHTYPELEPDREIHTYPTIEPGMAEIPEAGDKVTDMPSEEIEDKVDADVDDSSESDVTGKIPFLIDEAGMICGFSPEYADMEEGILSLPSEGCVGIRSGAFLGTGSEILELYIPANITRMEEGALSGMNRLEWIEAEEENEAYISVEGVLFDRAMTSLYAFPAGRTGTYKIPASVTYIAYGAFDNTTLFEIDMRDCPVIDDSALERMPGKFDSAEGTEYTGSVIVNREIPDRTHRRTLNMAK